MFSTGPYAIWDPKMIRINGTGDAAWVFHRLESLLSRCERRRNRFVITKMRAPVMSSAT